MSYQVPHLTSPHARTNDRPRPPRQAPPRPPFPPPTEGGAGRGSGTAPGGAVPLPRPAPPGPDPQTSPPGLRLTHDARRVRRHAKLRVFVRPPPSRQHQRRAVIEYQRRGRDDHGRRLVGLGPRPHLAAPEPPPPVKEPSRRSLPPVPASLHAATCLFYLEPHDRPATPTLHHTPVRRHLRDHEQAPTSLLIATGVPQVRPSAATPRIRHRDAQTITPDQHHVQTDHPHPPVTDGIRDQLARQQLDNLSVEQREVPQHPPARPPGRTRLIGSTRKLLVKELSGRHATLGHGHTSAWGLHRGENLPG